MSARELDEHDAAVDAELPKFSLSVSIESTTTDSIKAKGATATSCYLTAVNTVIMTFPARQCFFFVVDLSPVEEGDDHVEFSPHQSPTPQLAARAIRSLPEMTSLPPMLSRGRTVVKPVHKSASASMLTLLIPPPG